MKKLVTIAGAFVLCGIIGFSAHAQNLLLNGSFESPAIPANTISLATPTSWQGGHRLLNGNYGGSEYPGPQDGQQYAAIGSGAALSQAFTIATAGTYELSWFDNAGDHPDASPYSVTISSGAGVVASTSLNASHFPNWVSHSMQLNLSPGSYTLVFQSTGPAFGLATLIDNVSLPGHASDIKMVDATTTDFVHINLKYSVAGSDAPAFIIRAYISTDETFDPSDLPLSGQLGIADIADRDANADGSAKEHMKVMTLTTRAPVGDDHRFVIVAADPDAAISETNENNNAAFVIPIFAAGERMNRIGQKAAQGLPETDATASGPFTGAILRGTEDFDRLIRLDSFPDIPPHPWGTPPFVFGLETEPQPWQREEDRLGQPSLLQPTARLVSLINHDRSRVAGVWAGFQFSINEAHDSTGVHSPLALHYEGRAIDFDVIPGGGTSADSERLGRLAGLAWLSGFDWVLHETTHVHVSKQASFVTTINQQSLQESILAARLLGLIDNNGIANALGTKLDGVEGDLLSGNEPAALGKVGAFNNFVRAQRGKHINTAFANSLLLNGLILQELIDQLFP